MEPGGAEDECSGGGGGGGGRKCCVQSRMVKIPEGQRGGINDDNSINCYCGTVLPDV